MEMDQHAVELASRAGRPVVRGDWESIAFDGEKVGVLIMNQVLEHLISRPDEVVQRAFQILNQGGFWVIRTPNASSWGSRVFGEYWHPLEVPRHTVIYSVSGLIELVARYGFAVRQLRFTGRAYDLTQSAHYMQEAGRNAWFMHLLGRCLPLSCGARFWASAINLFRRGDSFELLLQKNI